LHHLAIVDRSGFATNRHFDRKIDRFGKSAKIMRPLHAIYVRWEPLRKRNRNSDHVEGIYIRTRYSPQRAAY
jgi:hypothetical protein